MTHLFASTDLLGLGCADELILDMVTGGGQKEKDVFLFSLYIISVSVVSSDV